METRYKNFFENKEKAITPFNLRIQTLLNEIKINPKIIHNTILPKTAPWTINQPIIKLENFLNIQNNFPDHHHIYTDGSKQAMKVGCAAVFQNQKLLKCLPNESSIYSAEVIAIDLAMNTIANYKSAKFIIYSDSKSVLQALQSKNSSTPLITRLLDKMNTLSKNNSIILTWIPSHIGIQRNEREDKAAKKALQTHISNTKIPYTDLKPLNKFILKKWQKSWNDQIQNKLHYIQDTISEWPAGYRRNRKEVIISRLRIGHTHIIHSHPLKHAKYLSQSNTFS